MVPTDRRFARGTHLYAAFRSNACTIPPTYERTLIASRGSFGTSPGTVWSAPTTPRRESRLGRQCKWMRSHGNAQSICSSPKATSSAWSARRRSSFILRRKTVERPVGVNRTSLIHGGITSATLQKWSKCHGRLPVADLARRVRMVRGTGASCSEFRLALSGP